jgi:predicted Zn-dependent protease
MLGPEDAETLAAIGQIHLTDGRLADAEPVLRRATGMRPDLAQARYAFGQTLLRLGRPDEAKSELAAFQRLRTESLERQRRTFDREILTREAELQARDGRIDAAAATWTTLITREPNDPAHRLALAGALVTAGRLTQALPHLEKAAALGAGPDVYRQLADVYAKLGRAGDSARARATFDARRRAATERAQ